MLRTLPILVVLAVPLATAAAATTEVTPADDLEAAVNALGPGDELIVHGGTYTLTSRFSFALAGTAAAPIVIRAADGEVPVIDRPTADQNIWDLERADYVTIRGLTFRGGSAGLRISAADHLTIEDCEIRDTGDVALRANDVGVTYTHLLIRHNHIHDTGGTGEGMYLGCNDDGCRLADSVIERNHVHHTNGPTVTQGDGIEIKEGSSGNVVRDNIIHDTGYPCILTYSAAGHGPANVIERNAMWGCGDHAIQAAADAIIRNNLILGSAANGIAMQPHQAGAPQNLVVVHNTIIHPTHDAIRASGIVGAVVIANNALYAQAGNAVNVGGDTSQLVVVGNRGVGTVTGAAGGFTGSTLAGDLVSGGYAGAPPMDLFPAVGSTLIGAGDPAYAVADDWNGTPRGGTVDVGAYAFAATGNPGWQLAADFKQFPGGVVPGDDGGGGDGDAGTTGATPASGCCQTGGRPARASLVLALLVVVVVVRRRRA
ncbi:MAG: right-handed parallel beta-helix repeat-containing protein [Kofleriaceae bacterium]